MLLATTTSVDDSGLLDSLLVVYHAGTAYAVRPIVVGSGEALALARRGDVDVVIAHSPADEARFMADGHGQRRVPVFANEFAIAGPAADPAGIAALTEAAAALRAIAAAGAPFISRGDDSGTHQAERALWRVAGFDPGVGYVEAGLGMAETLRLASERRAYTLTDMSTYRTLSAVLQLDVLLEGDPALRNPYSVITVRDAYNAAGADHFAAWLRGGAARAVINRFGAARFGAPLFRTWD